MSKQRRDALQTLNERNSPFVNTRTQEIFKNVANLNLRGSTYDAKHLDKFLNSDYGNQSYYPERVNRTIDETDLEASVQRNRSLHQHLPSYLVNSAAIKPSTSFLNLERDQIVFNAYVDLQDGPSGVQKRLNVPTMMERTEFAKTIYETERD